MTIDLQNFDHIIIFSRTIFLDGVSGKLRQATNLSDAPFKFDMGPSLFPAGQFQRLRLDKPLTWDGLRQIHSQLTIYDPSSALFQTVFGVGGAATKNESDFKRHYDYLISIMDDESAGLYRGLREAVGGNARLSWACSIDLIGLTESHLNDSAPTGIIGPFTHAEDSSHADAADLVVKVGPTGSYCYLPKDLNSEVANVIFWLGHAHYAFANLHETVRTLIKRQSDLSKARQLGPNQFHQFIESKIGILNTLSLTEPQVLGSRWVDFAVYDQIYRDWEISRLKGVCLELLDRLENIVSGLEEIRVRRNNFALSMLINLITMTSLFGVISYFWDFTQRQKEKLGAFGVNEDAFLSAEPIGIVAIGLAAVLFSFAAILRNR